jgi:transposase
MTVPPEKEDEIRQLLTTTPWPVGTIARQAGVHHDVVERIQAGLEPRDADPPPSRPRKIDPFIPFITETLTQYPRLGAARLFDLLQERGYDGSPRRVRALVHELRPRPTRPIYRHVEVLPGEQSQIDWGHLGRFIIDGALRDVWFFVMVLSWSRALWAELVLELSTSSLLRSLLGALRYFGGTTRQWVFDNAKAVVLDRSAVGVRFNPELHEFAAALHVLPKVCTPRRANEKGRVERTIRFLRDRHFAGRRFTGIDLGNKELLHFIDTIALSRPHVEDSSKTVREMLALERPRLLSLPAEMPSISRPHAATVDAYGYVRFETNDYAAPGMPRGQAIQLWVDARTVRLSEGTRTIAEYRRWYGKKRRMGSEHLDRVAAALHGDRRARSGRARLVSASPLMLSLMEAWLDEGRNMGSQVARALKLHEMYGGPVFAWAVEELARRGGTDMGALEQLCDVRRRATSGRVVPELKLGAHVPDRDVVTPSLEDYDDE